MKGAMLGIVLCAVVACGEPTESREADQCLRREIFKECMASLPRGPEHLTGGNDWDEVVTECASVAYYQSLRRESQIRPECRL